MAAVTEATRVTARTQTAPRIRVDRVVLYAIAVGLVFLLVWPFFWAVSSSLKEATEITARPPRLFPAAVDTRACTGIDSAG